MMAQTTVPFEPLQIHAADEAERIQTAIRDIVLGKLRRRGAVLGLSGGIDSSVAAALCVRALGRERVLGLFMPESDSSEESLQLGKILAESLGITAILEDISPILSAAGCYRRRDEAIRWSVPDFRDGWKSKLVMADLNSGARYAIPFLVVQAPDGKQTRMRLNAQAYSQIVAATNFKQRTRKMLEYYHADRLQYAVIGTPNRLEYDQGFFVKNGDGAADLKPLAHLYKSQVYQLAAHLRIPEQIQQRSPTADTFSLPQSQEEFYFSVPLNQMDMCLYGKNQGICPDLIARVTGLTVEQVQQVYAAIESRRKATRYLHLSPTLVEPLDGTAKTEPALAAGERA
jgi:NAD+ synthase